MISQKAVKVLNRAWLKGNAFTEQQTRWSDAQ